ncbi:hypothetical protein K439DRAFT_1408761, partial [Ramaria rubella]
MNRALEARKLVQTEDGLMEELQDAWSKKSFSRIRSLRILQSASHPSMKDPSRPVALPVPTSATLTFGTFGSPVRSSTEINQSIADFRKSVTPYLERFIVNRKFSVPTWKPMGTGDFLDHVRSSEIPMHDYGPSLLLHELGSPADEEAENVSNLFATRANKLLCNVSGAGKTRMLLQGLCKHWGFYFVCAVDSNKVGSADLATAIWRLAIVKGWTWTSSPTKKGHGFTAFCKNSRIAEHEFRKVLLGRLIILNMFLTIASENNFTLQDELRKLWTFVQVSPDLFRGYFDDIFRGAYERLAGIDAYDLYTFLRREEDEYRHLHLNSFVCVIDEAQVGAAEHKTAFVSDPGHSFPEHRPVLKPIADVMGKSYSYILSGTAISGQDISSGSSSGVGKPADFTMLHQTDRLDEQEKYAAFMGKYLSPGYLQSDAGKQFLKRSWRWLRGRYRFTTAFIEILLTSDGDCPHKLLDAFVEHFTGCRPNDGEESLRHDEHGDVPPIRLNGIYNLEQIASFANIMRDASMILFKYMTGRTPITSQSDDSQPKKLVGLGFARFIGKAVLINEPLVLLALAQWLERQREFTMKDILNTALDRSINSRSGEFHFEDVMTFYFYTAFQNFVPLDQIFNFVSPAPDWATESVRLVTYTRGENGEYRMAYLNSLRGDAPERPSAPMSRHGHESVLISWLKDQNYVPTFLPTTSMGPDNLTLLEFEDGRRMWMAAQVKCQQTGTSTNECAHAIKLVTPPFFHTLSWGETCERLRCETNEAMTSVPNLMPGTPVLRVI